MKKSFLFAALMLTAAVFTGCNSNSTPMNDTTKLWPACNSSGTKVGFIDQSGAMKIDAMYDAAVRFSCGYARVRLADNYMFLDSKGKTVQGSTDFSYGCDPYFYYNYCGFCVKSGLWGMMDKDLTTVIQPAYAWIGNMSDEGLVCARMDGAEKYGYLNKKGEWAIPSNYEDAAMFEDGVAVVRVGDKWGAIDTKGQFQINANYDMLESLGEGRLSFCNDAKTRKGGMMDTKGNVIVQPIYDGCSFFADNGLLPVRQDDKWGYINKSGDIKLPFNYYSAAPFYEGYAWIKRTDKSEYELIDINGNTVIRLGEKDIPNSVFHNGLCQIYTKSEKGETYKYIDTKGNMVYSWTFTYDYDAPARVAADREMNIAEMFAGTPYGARFNKK